MPLPAFGKNRNLKTPFFPYWCSEEHVDRRVWAGECVTSVKKPEHSESQKRDGK